jgi:hypothetical protein
MHGKMPMHLLAPKFQPTEMRDKPKGKDSKKKLVVKKKGNGGKDK